MFPLLQLFRNTKIQPTHHTLGWISQFDSQLRHGTDKAMGPAQDGAVHQDGGARQSHCLGQDSTAPPRGSVSPRRLFGQGVPSHLTTPGPLHCFSHHFIAGDYFF